MSRDNGERSKQAVCKLNIKLFKASFCLCSYLFVLLQKQFSLLMVFVDNLSAIWLYFHVISP